MKSKEKATNPWISVGVLVFSAFIATFNETILNVALLSISNQMHVTTATVQWVITGYMLVTSIMVPVTAFLFQSIPTKKLFTSAMGIILIGSIGCFAAVSFPMLLIFRMVQAVGTGMMIPIMMSTTLLVAPKEKIGTAMALCVCGITLGPAFGPTISGVILQFFTWRATFMLLSILVIIAIIIGNFVIKNIAELTHPHLDILSVILSSVGLAFFLYGISTIINKTELGIICIIIGAVILAIFVMRQRTLKEPMLNFSPFKMPIFTFGVVMVSIAMLENFSLNVILPSFLQGALFASSLMSALVLLPGILLNAVSTNISGKILDKHGAKGMLIIGFIICSAGFLWLSTAGIKTTLIMIIVMHVIIYQGLAFTMSPAQTSALQVLPRELNAHGVAIVNTFMQIAASLGSSLLGGVQASVKYGAINKGVPERQALVNGFSSALYVAVGICIIGFICAIIFSKLKNKKTA